MRRDPGTRNRGPFHTSLQTRLVSACIGLLSLSLVLAIALLVIEGKTYQLAKQSFEALRLYREVLVAANAISAERGPTNTLLGGDYPPSDEAWVRLQRSRAQTDSALQRIANTKVGDAPGSPAVELTRSEAELATARARIDALLTHPFRERPLDAIRTAIEGMFKAVDAIKPLINETALYTHGETSSLVDEALIGQKLLEIRDYAGRLGSILTPYIAWRQPLTPEDQNRLQQTLGRIQQLWELTRPYLERQPELAADIANVETIFFGNGMDLVRRLDREALTGQFSFSTRTMTNTLVPTFTPLESVRLAYLDFMLKQSTARLHSAQVWFVAVGSVTGIIIVLDVLLVFSIERMIFRPLLKARDSIVALSEEYVQVEPATGPGQRSEIDEVSHAIDILAIKLLERRRLMEQLKRQATTDSLTGLFNRRTLDEIGLAGPSFFHLPDEIGLILLDIDRFKSINDTYGHTIGDEVLKSVAALLTKNCRSTDLVARFGGEEFAIILPATTIEQVVSIADGLRAAIAAQRMNIGRNHPLGVTASFGVATGQRGAANWTSLLKKADEALYAAKNAGRNCVCRASGN